MSNGIILLLGTNLGKRIQNLEDAKLLIARQVGTIIRESSIYETEPWGVTDQPNYLNMVVQIDTALPPQEVLSRILLIEKELGRVRSKKWEARKIDIDLLFYNDAIIDTEELQVPHPRLHERKFTLFPLIEITPDFIHPVLQKSINTLMKESSDPLTVRKLENNL